MNLYIFSFTPILQLSTDSQPNIGFVSLCFVLMTVIGTSMFEIIIAEFKMKAIYGLIFILSLEGFVLFTIYYSESYFIRLIGLSAINVLSKFN